MTTEIQGLINMNSRIFPAPFCDLGHLPGLPSPENFD